MVLRGVFLGTKEEAYWAFHYASKYFYPEIIDSIEFKLKEPASSPKCIKNIFEHINFSLL